MIEQALDYEGLKHYDEKSKEYVTEYVTDYVQTELDVIRQAIIDVDAINEAKGSPILLTDTAEGSLSDIKVYGRSTQDGTPTPDSPQAIKSVSDGGYFDGELLQGYYNADGVYTSSATDVCNKNPIPCKEGDCIKLIYEEIVSALATSFYDENMVFITRTHETNTNKYEVIVPVNAKYMNFHIDTNANITPQTAKKIVVTINDTYACIVKSKGKNLLNIRESDKDTTNFTYSEYTNEYVKATALTTDTGAFLCSYSAYLEKDKTYIFSHENASLSQIYIYSDKLWGNFITTTNIVDNPKYTHIAESGKYIIAYYIGMDVLALGTEYSVVKPMLRLAEVTDINYKPYTESVNTIALSEPLRSVGAVKDEVSPTEVTKRFAEVVFDGSDDEVISAFGSTYPHLFVISVSGVKKTTSNIICTHFQSYTNVGSDYSKNMIYSLDNQIFINHIDITTVDEFKAWLKANPITVVYELTEPIVEAIEPVDITTYDNITYITASDNADMWVEYYSSSNVGQRLAYTNEEMRTEHAHLQEQIDETKQEIIDSNAISEVIGSPILVTDSIEGVAADIEVYGRSTQTQYTGKNLLDCSGLSTTTTNGVTFTPYYDDNGSLLYINVNGTASDLIEFYIAQSAFSYNEDTILTGSPNGATPTTYSLRAGGVGGDIGNGALIPANTETLIYIQIHNGVTVSNLNFYPMIRLATETDSTYEPYVGGTVAPNPDYPQAIESVADGGWFDGELMTGFYSATGSYVQQSAYVCSKNPIPCNGDDTVKVIYATISSELVLIFYDKDMNFISRLYDVNVTEYEGIAPTNAKYVHFYLREPNTVITPTTAKPISVTINGKYALIVKSKGKNLLENTAKSQTINGVTFTVNSDGSVTANGTATATAVFYLSTNLENGHYILSGCTNGSQNTYGIAVQLFERNTANNWYCSYTGDAKFEVSADKVFGYCYIQVNNGVTVNNVTFYPMIRKAEVTDGTYEPYKETVSYIPLNEPLRSNLDGSVTDEVSLTEVTRRFGKFVLNGTENWYFTANANAYISLGGWLKPNGIVISDYYVVNRTQQENTILVNSTNVIIYDKRFATVDEWKTWLAENNVTLIYELKEPIVETIEPVDIVTYDNVTYLTASDNADMKIRYFKDSVDGNGMGDLTLMLRKEIKELKEQILTLQAAILNI